MKCQILFSGKNKKDQSVLSAEFANSALSAQGLCYIIVKCIVSNDLFVDSKGLISMCRCTVLSG